VVGQVVCNLFKAKKRHGFIGIKLYKEIDNGFHKFGHKVYEVRNAGVDMRQKETAE
jgi:hypothetical protein